ncbi:MAG: response regulator [Desulfobacterales bacterium]|nr:response regulator [Desulfobacterales bacterium]
MKISIRWALILGLLVIIWGTQAITVSSSYITSQRVLLGHAQDIMENIAEFAMEQSKNHLALAQGAAHLTKRLISANVVSNDNQKFKSLERYFFDQMAIYPHFAGIYFGAPNGDFFDVRRSQTHSPTGFRTKIIRHPDGVHQVDLVYRDKALNLIARQTDPNDNYDPRIRPWYKKAKHAGDIVWTDPYVFFTSQKPGITIAGPVYRGDNSLKGIVGVDIRIDQLSTFIEKLRIGKNGKAFLLNRNMDVVAFPDLTKITRPNALSPGKTRLVKITEIDDALSRQAFEAVKWDKDAKGRLVIEDPLFAKFENKGKVYNVMFSPFSDRQWPWLIGVYLPEDDYLGEIKANRMFNLFVTIAISIMTTFAALIMARGIIRPIAELEHESKAIRSHEFDNPCEVNSIYKEIQETADSFACMRESLVSYEDEKSKLEKQVRHSQKMEAIGTLAGGVAHDFNNILYPILGYTEMAIDEVPDGSPASESLNEIMTAAQRARKLVEQILTFSRLDHQGRIPLKIQSAVKESLNLLRATLPVTIDVVQQIDTDCGPVLADPTQIQQVVMNLCTNAFHAMQNHGGTLTIGLEEIQIASEDLPTSHDPVTYVKLTVSDTGYGMSKDVLERIFEPYFTTKKVGEGTGMGLAVVHGIIKGYDGDIQVYSDSGNGTAFNVYLPRIYEDTKPEGQTPVTIQKGDEHILLIDDEDQITRMLEQMLVSLGYKVQAVCDPLEALELFENAPQSFDLVITDMTMPKITGDLLARELMKIRPDIPVMLCTGFSKLIDEERAFEIGIKKLIMKPVIKSEIAGAIREVLNFE